MKLLGLLAVLCCCVMVSPGCNQKSVGAAAVPFVITEGDGFAGDEGTSDSLLKAAAVKLAAIKGEGKLLSSGVNTPYGILTCFHCVNGATFPIKVTCGDETADAYLKAFNAESDLALLSVNWTKSHFELELSRSELEVGQDVRSVGRGVDGTISIESHSILKLGRGEFYATNPFPHGRSGSAVVSSRGAIVGIVSDAVLSVEPYQGICVDNGVILGFLTGNNTAGPAVGGIAKKKFRALMWAPSWCTVCINNDWLLEGGDGRVVYEHKLGIASKGDEKAFPKEVQDYANGTFPAGSALAGQQRGYPVWQIELEDGTWGFAHHARSFDDLVAIHKLKPGQPIPKSTFQQAVADRQGKRQADGLSQVAPRIR